MVPMEYYLVVSTIMFLRGFTVFSPGGICWQY